VSVHQKLLRGPFHEFTSASLHKKRPAGPPRDAGEHDRPLTPLRLPATILTSLFNESRLAIHRASDGGGPGEDDEKRLGATASLSLVVTQAGKGEQSGDSYLLEEASDQNNPTDWYQSSMTTMLAVEKAPSNKKGQINNTPSNPNPKDLKEIGERTRKLLERELKKRKEIVRLEGDADILPPLPK